MSEKRFTGEFDKELSGIYDNGEQLTNFEVVDLLNELGRIIFDQRHNLGQLMDIISNMNRKNEQLKSEYKVLHTQYKDLKKFVENNFDEHLTQKELNRQIIKLSNENEQLKQQIKDLRLNVLDNIHKAGEAQCCCNPCVVEEYVKKMIK